MTLYSCFIRVKLNGVKESPALQKSTLRAEQIDANTFEVFMYNYLTNIAAGDAYMENIAVEHISYESK